MKPKYQIIFHHQEEIVRLAAEYPEDVTALLSFVDYSSFDSVEVYRYLDYGDRTECVEVTEEFFAATT